VERLSALQAEAPAIEVRDPSDTLSALVAESTPHAQAATAQPSLHLLVRTPEQLEAAIAVRPASITLDYLELYGLAPSVDRIRAAGIEPRVASPRMLKPAEERVVHFLLKLACPILVRSTGLLSSLQDRPHPMLTGDFSLNAANTVSAAELMRFGLERLTPGHDLNAAQVADLARAMGAGTVEAIAYQHLPVFHTEHCVFCRFLSTGTSYLDCGRPCEKHQVALRDTAGRAHAVIADVGCRNTVFGAQAQEASAHMNAWLDAGIRHFRLEFVHESPARVESITEAFAAFLAKRSTAPELGRRLKQLAPEGTTEGSLFVPASSELLPVLR
jgi:putative protease